MEVLTNTLLIANLVVVAAGATVIAKEMDKLNKRVETLENSLDLKDMKGELKEHISKEFLAMAFRGIKIK